MHMKQICRQNSLSVTERNIKFQVHVHICVTRHAVAPTNDLKEKLTEPWKTFNVFKIEPFKKNNKKVLSTCSYIKM